MGIGLKKNTTQTPDVETPCTHTHTQSHAHKGTQMRLGGNEDHKAPPLACRDWLVWSSGEIQMLALFDSKQTKDGETKA